MVRARGVHRSLRACLSGVVERTCLYFNSPSPLSLQPIISSFSILLFIHPRIRPFVHSFIHLCFHPSHSHIRHHWHTIALPFRTSSSSLHHISLPSRSCSVYLAHVITSHLPCYPDLVDPFNPALATTLAQRQASLLASLLCLLPSFPPPHCTALRPSTPTKQRPSPSSPPSPTFPPYSPPSSPIHPSSPLCPKQLLVPRLIAQQSSPIAKRTKAFHPTPPTMDKPLQAYPGREIRSETTSTPQPHPIVSEQLLRLQPHIWPDCQECSGMDIPAERDQEKDPFDHHLQLEQRRSLSTTFNHNDRNDRNDDMNDNAANTDINHSEEEERKGGEKEEEEITSTPFQVPSDISRIWSASTSSTTVAYSNEARNTLDVAARASSIGTRTETRMRTRTRTRAARRVVVPESGVFPSVLFPSSSTLEEQEWDSNKLDTEVASGSVLRPGRSLAIVTSFKEGQTEEDMSMTDRTATRAFRTHSRTHPSTSEVAHSEHEHASSSAHGSLSALQMQLTVSPTRASTATPSTPTTTNMTMTPTSSSPSFSSSSSSPFFSSTTATTPTSSTSPSEPKADAATPLVDQDCAICLDSILPRNHAKATLACRHEFHLSCISMAFSMGKEMVCPLCRYLHKDQPFMCLESDAKPLRTLLTSSSTTSTTASSGTTTVSPRGMNGRNRHNSIHLQQHLSNLVQHQRHHQRHRRDNSTSSQDNTTPPSTSPATSPRASTVLSSIPFFGSTSTSSAFHGRPVSSQLYNYNRRNSSSPRDAYPSTSPFSIPHGHYINMTTWFMLYVVPFSVAILFLAFLLGRAETLWSRVSCLVGSVICYMICWAIAVACLLSQEETTTAFFSPPVQHVSYPQQQIQGFPIEYEIEPDTMTMGQGATHPAALSSYEDNVSAEESWHSPTFLAPYYPTPPMTSPPAPQVRRLSPAATLVQLATSSFSSAAGAAAHLLSFSQGWTTSRYAQDLQNRVMDLAEVLDDYSESFGEW